MMSPKELAIELRVSEKQQSKLRQEGRFPIPHKEFGRTISYSINAIADFILTGTAHKEVVTQESKTQAPPHSVAKQKRRSGVQDLSQILLATNFVMTLEEQLTNIQLVHGHLTKLIKAKTLEEALEATLPNKSNEMRAKRTF